LKFAVAATMDVRLLAIAFDARTIYRFIFLAPVSEAASLSVDFRRTTHSFRRLRRGEAASVLPRRIKIIKVGSGDSLRSLADRMPFEDFRLERFQVLNGFAPGQKPAPGQMVKIITD
jgi:predicted Zn-dependent protease